MITKKLAAPLINEKILHEAEHCYIATASISESAFDFIKSRLSPKCKIEIVTGLDEPTSPQVLKRIWNHYQDRITLNIYTKNFFHPNVYIFDLPYRKGVAFVGSGNFTLGGLKDNEEIFYKIKDSKEIEALKSWFTGYYEFAEPLTEAIIQEYEWIYPSLKQLEIKSRQEKKQFIELTAGGFHWDGIKFKNQFFKKEDYLVLKTSKAFFNTPEIQAERIVIYDKFLTLHESIKPAISNLRVLRDYEIDFVMSSLDPLQHYNHRICALWIAYGENVKAQNGYSISESSGVNSMRFQVVLKPKEFGIWLLPGRNDRQYVNEQLNDVVYRNAFFKLLTTLRIESNGNDHWLYVAGEKRTIENFQNEDAFGDFLKSDPGLHFDFIIGKTYMPGAPEINADTITATITKEFEKLTLLYELMRRKKENV